MTKKLNLQPGNTFGHWTLIRELPPKKGKRFWLCRCSCGVKKEVSQSALTTGSSKSCGCQATYKSVNDLTGKKFGRLTVKERSQVKKNGRIMWLCKCECGNYVNVPGVYLTTGQTQSCGCLKKDQDQKNMREKLDEQYIDDVNTSLLRSKLREDNKSGVKGVAQHKPTGKWDAYITVNKRRISLGRFKNKIDAIKARQLAEEKYHKPYLEEFKNEQRNDKKVD